MMQGENLEALEQSLAELPQLAVRGERLLQQRPQEEFARIACGPGCGSCCVVNVSTLLPEGIAIRRYLTRFSAAEQQQLAARLEELWETVRGLDDEERLVVRRKCAFLNAQGRCQIYPVRPLLCRSITSTDAQSCQDALTGAVFGDERPVLMHQYQQQLYESLFSEFAGQLEERGLDGRSFQLSGLVRFLLNHPDAEADFRKGHRLTWQEFY